MKWRNSKERELIATGGSREQTLPTKNNPNPDLSDPQPHKKDHAEAVAGNFQTSTTLHGISLHPTATRQVVKSRSSMELLN
jgi:hypothetical protein